MIDWVEGHGVRCLQPLPPKPITGDDKRKVEVLSRYDIFGMIGNCEGNILFYIYDRDCYGDNVLIV